MSYQKLDAFIARHERFVTRVGLLPIRMMPEERSDELVALVERTARDRVPSAQATVRGLAEMSDLDDSWIRAVCAVIDEQYEICLMERLSEAVIGIVAEFDEGSYDCSPEEFVDSGIARQLQEADDLGLAYDGPDEYWGAEGKSLTIRQALMEPKWMGVPLPDLDPNFDVRDSRLAWGTDIVRRGILDDVIGDCECSVVRDAQWATFKPYDLAARCVDAAALLHRVDRVIPGIPVGEIADTLKGAAAIATIRMRQLSSPLRDHVCVPEWHDYEADFDEQLTSFSAVLDDREPHQLWQDDFNIRFLDITDKGIVEKEFEDVLISEHGSYDRNATFWMALRQFHLVVYLWDAVSQVVREGDALASGNDIDMRLDSPDFGNAWVMTESLMREHLRRDAEIRAQHQSDGDDYYWAQETGAYERAMRTIRQIGAVTVGTDLRRANARGSAQDWSWLPEWAQTDAGAVIDAMNDVKNGFRPPRRDCEIGTYSVDSLPHEFAGPPAVPIFESDRWTRLFGELQVYSPSGMDDMCDHGFFTLGDLAGHSETELRDDYGIPEEMLRRLTLCIWQWLAKRDQGT